MAVFRVYSLGVLVAMTIFMVGALLYMRHEDMQTFGAKVMVGMGVVLLALIWPISGPAAAGYAVKSIIGYIVRKLARDAEDELT